MTAAPRHEETPMKTVCHSLLFVVALALLAACQNNKPADHDQRDRIKHEAVMLTQLGTRG